ncbi:MAG TPA: MFS transporter [Acidimicrobiia bacterium]|jgi:MFS family permease
MVRKWRREGAPDAPPRQGRAARSLRRARSLAIDLTPLRTSRDFRLLWLGEIVSETGSQFTLVALYIQVYALTHSSLAVGAIGVVQLVPLLIVSIFGSPLIDRVDRRRLLLVSQFVAAGGSALLWIGAAAGHPPLALIYTAAAIVGGVSGFALSTRSAMTPTLVPERMLSQALALNQAMWNTALIAGPAIGGILIAQVGLSSAYAVDTCSFAATIVAAFMMAPRPPVMREDAEQVSGLRAVGEGFRYLRGRQILQCTFAVDLIAMIFGMPRALFPVLAVVQFHQGAEVVGFLLAAPAIGALIAALTTGWVGRVERQGLAVLVAVAIWGFGITTFGLAGDNLAVAMVCLAIAGGADVISAVFRSTILQLSVPDDLRGRMSAVHILVVTGGPRLGDLEAGAVASVFTPTISVVSGGLICLGGVVALGLGVPAFARYRVGDEV